MMWRSFWFLLLAIPYGNAVEIDFVRDVRPILELHCQECHGADRQKSGLRLDIRAAAFRGGEYHGPAILPGKSAESPLMRFVMSQDPNERMPFKKPPVSAAEIAILKEWIDAGAAWPDGVDLAVEVDPTKHWAFQPLSKEPATNPSASPSPSLPPWVRNPIDQFILDKLNSAGLKPSPEASKSALLRRITLDLTGLPPSVEQARAFMADVSDEAFVRVVDRLLASPRYGERWGQHWLDVVRYADTHGFEVNTERPNAWPYRDYIIDSFNNDLPYNRFILEQIAGDAVDQGAATGFLVTASVLLPGQIGADDVSKRLARQDALDEIVVNNGQTFLGLSIGCARCHDHKFDPISARDYYSMQAFFAGVEYGDRKVPMTPAVADTEVETRDIFAGIFRDPDSIHLLHRGDPEQPRDPITPAVPKILGDLSLESNATEQVRRLTLGHWIADDENPLTARVMVNRIWQGHFGTGLVDTPNDFGLNGVPPSHPELLDWLAIEFVRSGWSIKQMHRLIVTSATYRQSSRVNPIAAALDSDVRLLWRFPSRRIEAEPIRDSILATSGQLNFESGGRGFDLFDQRGGLSGFKPVEEFSANGLRRMIYAHKVRRERDVVFGAFDCPDAGQSTARRIESTTPIQALNLFNSRFTLDQAEAFAERLSTASGNDIPTQIRHAFEIAVGRSPEPDELSEAAAVVRDHGLPTLCRVLFNSNEFLYLP